MGVIGRKQDKAPCCDAVIDGENGGHWHVFKPGEPAPRALLECPCGGEPVDVVARGLEWKCGRCGREYTHRGGWTCGKHNGADYPCDLMAGHPGEHRMRSAPSRKLWPPEPKRASEHAIRGVLLVAGIDLERVTFAQEYPDGDHPVDAAGRSPEAVAAAGHVVTIRGAAPAPVVGEVVAMGWRVDVVPPEREPGWTIHVPSIGAEARADYLDQKRRRFRASRGWK